MNPVKLALVVQRAGALLLAAIGLVEISDGGTSPAWVVAIAWLAGWLTRDPQAIAGWIVKLAKREAVAGKAADDVVAAVEAIAAAGSPAAVRVTTVVQPASSPAAPAVVIDDDLTPIEALDELELATTRRLAEPPGGP